MKQKKETTAKNKGGEEQNDERISQRKEEKIDDYKIDMENMNWTSIYTLDIRLGWYLYTSMQTHIPVSDSGCSAKWTY